MSQSKTHYKNAGELSKHDTCFKPVCDADGVGEYADIVRSYDNTWTVYYAENAVRGIIGKGEAFRILSKLITKSGG